MIIREERISNVDIEFGWDGDSLFSIFINGVKYTDIIRQVESNSYANANRACIEIYQNNFDEYKAVVDNINTSVKE